MKNHNTMKTTTLASGGGGAKCWHYIKADWLRYWGNDDTRYHIVAFLKAIVLVQPFSFNLWFRLAAIPNVFWCVYPVIFLMLRRVRRKQCLQISKDTKIGEGLVLLHSFGVIINPHAVIGKNCTILQFTTIGEKNGKCPVIGDNVTICANCNIIGGIRIGDNVTIGAGSVVTKDIPNNATAAGNPARVLRYK